jgi:hypothetical protein
MGVFLAATRLCWAYSLLTHEEIVDMLWQERIEPLLLKRFPAASEVQLRQAHAYAYGGCLIQDIGYYPFGNKFFSDLTHYVRTGDFAANLIRESADLEQYAFALGALAHYSSDNSGHPFINHSVALTFPKLRARYGETVTYEECPKAHIQTEFGFDITQVAKGRFTSDQYHDFIGFEVSKPVLERAFLRTYGLRLEEVLGHEELAIGTFRRAASKVIPEMTRAALTVHHPELVRETRDFSRKRFLYTVSRARYEAEWGKVYRRPGVLARCLGEVVRWAPRLGILKALDFKIPTPQTEDLYIKSINRTVADYRWLLGRVDQGDLDFPNTDCDIGRLAAPGQYLLSDETYARLLDQLVKAGLERVRPDLRANLLAFFLSSDAPTRAGEKAGLWTREEVEALEAGPASPLAVALRQRLLAPPFKLQSPKGQEAEDSLQRWLGHGRQARKHAPQVRGRVYQKRTRPRRNTKVIASPGASLSSSLPLEDAVEAGGLAEGVGVIESSQAVGQITG